MVIFIDESGTLPDVTDKYIVLVALVSFNPEQLKNILPKFRKKTPGKGPRKKERVVKEFKFHYVGEITRIKVLLELNTKSIKVYALVVDKMGRKIADTPQNYGKLIEHLIKKVKQKENLKEVHLDKHFGNKNDTDKLQSLLESRLNRDLDIRQINSMQDSRIDLADFVAGAILRKYRGSDLIFYKIIKPKIIKEEIKKWNEL